MLASGLSKRILLTALMIYPCFTSALVPLQLVQLELTLQVGSDRSGMVSLAAI